MAKYIKILTRTGMSIRIGPYMTLTQDTIDDTMNSFDLINQDSTVFEIEENDTGLAARVTVPIEMITSVKVIKE